MFPGESSTNPDSYNPSSFSSSSSSASTPTISADNVNLYNMHPHYPDHHQHHVSYYSDYSQADSSLDATMNSSRRNQSIQAAMSAGYISREQAQLLIMQDPGSAPHALQLQGLSMNYMQAQFYNDQILRSVTGSHCIGIEPSSVYERQELLNSIQAQESSPTPREVQLQNRGLQENLGRAVASDHPSAPARYEETCTPRPRWSPTQEQIEILEALFNSGTRTPSRDMITEIAAELRKYGTIAEANVFYWFQNRKARAKRKQLQPASRNPAS